MEESLGETITLAASDRHSLSAYTAGDAPRGLVVLQEIFGVNEHIRSVVDRFAAQGFSTIAPALFDRIEPGIELGYEAADVERGREFRGYVSTGDALKDITASADVLLDLEMPVAVIGYCWGGSLAWACASRLPGLAAAVGYYGGEIAKMKDETPNCPVMLHFGETDHAIPMTDVEAVKAAHPGIPVHTYPAGHGFSCDARGSFHPESHKEALDRTLAFLNELMPI